MLTRTHFRKVAEFMRSYPDGGVVPKQELIEFLSGWFHEDNPRFSRDRFRAACEDQGVGPTPTPTPTMWQRLL